MNEPSAAANGLPLEQEIKSQPEGATDGAFPVATTYKRLICSRPGVNAVDIPADQMSSHGKAL
jgi:hypothetical protein